MKFGVIGGNEVINLLVRCWLESVRPYGDNVLVLQEGITYVIRLIPESALVATAK